VTEYWQAETLRVTTFPGTPLEPEKTAHWWTQTVGSEPAQRTYKPGQSALEVKGDWDGHNLLLKVVRNRVDWLLNPGPSDIESRPLPAVGSLDVLSPFAKLVQTWLGTTAGPWQRLAFGAELFLPVRELEDSKKELRRFVPDVNVDAVGLISDFSIALNKIRESRSGIKDLLINRGMKWSVVIWKTMSVTVTAGVGNANLDQNLSRAVQLVLDINTSPEYTRRFDADQASRLILEFQELALEICDRGAIP
jgi:hypothetical protein